MNKTVNINLAGTFFHIDEDAYLKLQRYLEAIKRSFTDSQGRSEIVADIEARISELFSERVKHDKQVIGNKEVDDVITIMGQPEDYLVDDEIFEDEPQPSYKSSRSSSNSKKLFRDTDNSYIAGVSSGLGHYLGIDAIWVRLLWVLLTIGSGGTFILIYILFWVLVPEALTTSEKLTMKGEPVNISNIEKKIKDGFDHVSQTVSDTVQSMDLPKQGNRIKSSSKNFFDTIGDIILFCFKVAGKFIGIILMIVGASALIGLIIALFSVGIADAVNIPGLDYINATNAANIPIWLMCIIGLVVVGVKQASEFSEEASFIQKELLNIQTSDTLFLSMRGNSAYSKQFGRHSNDLKPIYDEDGHKLIYSTDVILILKSTKDSVAYINIDKNSRGNTYQNAKMRAEKISYNYELKGNRLELDGFLTTAFENKYRGQGVEVTIYIPEGIVLFADETTNSFHRTHFFSFDSGNGNYEEHTENINNGDMLNDGMEGHYLKVLNNEIKCLDCPEDDGFKVKVDLNDNGSEFKLDENGVRIKNDSNSVEINSKGIKSESESVKVKIGSNGIEITSDDN